MKNKVILFTIISVFFLFNFSPVLATTFEGQNVQVKWDSIADNGYYHLSYFDSVLVGSGVELNYNSGQTLIDISSNQISITETPPASFGEDNSTDLLFLT